MLSKIFASSLTLFAVQAMKVTQVNSDSIEDPDDFGYFRDRNVVYNMQTAEEKKADLWEKIIEDDTMQDYLWTDFAGQFTAAKNGSFCNDSDEQKKNRPKIAHRQGVVGQINWKSLGNHEYTGFYKTGTQNAYVRFSQTTNLTEDSDGLMPSLAIKALRNNAKSQNLFGMASFFDSHSWDFFNDTMKNRVEPFQGTDEEGNDNEQDLIDTIIAKMVEGDNQPYSTGISNFAEYDEIEQLERQFVVSPYELQYTSPFKGYDYQTETWWENLLEVGQQGAHILDVWALSEVEATPQHIAEIYLTTDLVTSKFGDERMHFQHLRTKRDYKYWGRTARDEFLEEHIPFEQVIHEWDISAWPTESEEEAEDYYMEQIDTYGCPFAFLWQSGNQTTPPVKDDVVEGDEEIADEEGI